MRAGLCARGGPMGRWDAFAAVVGGECLKVRASSHIAAVEG